MMEFRKEFFADERDDDLHVIGERVRRQDILGHVTGRSPFYDDHRFEGLLHIRCARSPHHHARIRRIDTSAAERMPGVVRVLTGADVPRNLNTLLSLLDFGLDDEPILAETKVAYRGEPVAAVIADTEARARDAVAAIRVDWEELPHVLDPEQAIRPGAPVVCDVYPTNRFIYHGKYDHQKLRYGDVEAAFAEADHIVEGRYQMSPIEQAPIETCGAIAAPETNDRYVCYTGTQGLFFSLGTAAKVLQMPSSRLHFVGGTVGGGFGGKVDSVHEPIAILGAMLTGRPCKFAWDREEEMQVGAPRGAERWYLKDAVTRDGRILARKFTGYFDSGAYTRLSSYAVIKAVGHLPGPYTIPNVHADVFCVYTNRTPSTAMRGFGITGVDFAIECHMDKVAEVVGLNPIDLRILNAYRDGDMKAHRRAAKNCALVECCQVVAGKSAVALSEPSRTASSLTGGGGPRGDLPAFTRTDEDGRIEGFDTGSYARKAGTAAPAAQPGTTRPAAKHPAAVQPAAPQPAAARSAPPAPRPTAPPSPPSVPPLAAGQRADAGGSMPPVDAAPGPGPDTPARHPARRTGALRFSSLSGFRRR